MRFVFFGTDEFSVSILDELKKAGLLPALVVTVPDRPKGRGLTLASSPAKEWALKNVIPILQPEKLDGSLAGQLSKVNGQLFIVASYGLIIPKAVLDIPKRGMLNVHPSLLPKYRGATPIESQIVNGEKEVGVTIMLMDEKMDHGPIVAERRLEIRNPNIEIRSKSQAPNAPELRKTLAEEGGRLLAEVIPKWVEGKLEAKPQDESKATYTKKLTKTDGEINLNGDPYKNFLKIQAFKDSIGTYFHYADARRLKTQMHADKDSLNPRQSASRPASIRVVIKAAEFKDGKLLIMRVVPEGKKEMSYEEFLRGLK